MRVRNACLQFLKGCVSAFPRSAKALRSPRVLAAAGMLLALQVVLNLFVSVPIPPNLRISFGYLSMALSGALLGPVPAMLQGALADLIGCLVKPMGPYFPGYTLTALLNGLLYGCTLFERKPKLWLCLAVQFFADLLLNVMLNTAWLTMTGGKAFLVLLPTRLLKNAILWPIESVMLWVVWIFTARLAARSGLSADVRRLGGPVK